jgi:predicted negative regulator of RcsB-dependent stress response
VKRERQSRSSAVVKRIKKRIPKQENPAETEGEEFADEVGAQAAAAAPEMDGLDPDLPSDAEPGDIRTQLAEMADDEFTRKTASAFSWIIEKKTVLISLAVIGLVGVGIYMFTQSSKTAAAEEAAAAFQNGADPYVESSAGDDAAKRKEQIDKAVTAFETTRAQYKDRRISTLATLGLAGARFDQGKNDDAKTLYDEFLGRPDTDPFAKAIALQGKAVALEDKGDHQGAVDAWKAVEGLSRDAYGLMANVQIGRLLEASGKNDAAKAHYTKVQTDYSKALEELSNRALKAQIDRRLAVLTEGS